MQLNRESTNRRKIKIEETPISTATNIPSQNQHKTIWIGKLVNRYLKEMEREQLLSPPKKPKIQTVRKPTNKQIPRKTRLQKNLLECHPKMTERTLKTLRRPDKLSSCKQNKCRSVNNLTRKRYDSNPSRGKQHTKSDKNLKRRINKSIDACKQKEKRPRDITPSSESIKRISRNASDLSSESPFKIYFKSWEH